MLRLVEQVFHLELEIHTPPKNLLMDTKEQPKAKEEHVHVEVVDKLDDELEKLLLTVNLLNIASK